MNFSYIELHCKKSRYGSTKISLGNVEEWCNEHSRIPENEDEPYVAAYSVHYGDDDDEDDNNDNDDEDDENKIFSLPKDC